MFVLLFYFLMFFPWPWPYPDVSPSRPTRFIVAYVLLVIFVSFFFTPRCFYWPLYPVSTPPAPAGPPSPYICMHALEARGGKVLTKKKKLSLTNYLLYLLIADG